MKYLLFLLLLTGCSDEKICQGVRGFHAFYGGSDVECNGHGFAEPYSKEEPKEEKYLTNEEFFKHVQSYCEAITNEGHPERAPGTQFVKCLRAWGY